MTELSATATPARTRYFNQHWTWWFTVAVLVLMAAVRLRLLNFPLERDEGEYAYAGQLMLQGIPPYELAFNMKFPGTYAMYALIMALFGETPAGIHLGVTIITTLTSLMLYWLGKRMLDATAGMVAATTYAVLAANTALFGLAGHATHFEAFFATAGLCLMWKARQSARWQTACAAGIMCGLATLMKQHAAVIAAWAFGMFVWEGFSEKESGWNPVILEFRGVWNRGRAAGGAVLFDALVRGGFSPVLVLDGGLCATICFNCIHFGHRFAVLVERSLDGFGGFFVVASMPGRIRNDLVRRPVAANAMVAAGIQPGIHPDHGSGFLFSNALFSFDAAGAGVAGRMRGERVGELLRRRAGASRFSGWPAGVYVLLVALTIIKTSDVWFVFAAQGGHALYGAELFPEAETVSKFIHDNSKPDAQIAVLGLKPEIYFLSHRHSATGYIYAYPLMEPQPFAHKMQVEMIQEIETNAPEFIIFVNQNFSWVQAPQSDVTIFKWWNDYKTNYATVGLVEQHWPYPSQFFWGQDAVVHGKLKGTGLEIYQRREYLASGAVQPDKMIYRARTMPRCERCLTPAVRAANFPLLGAKRDSVGGRRLVVR